MHISTNAAAFAVDEATRRLHAAGWSVGEVASGSTWIVTGNNGENVIQAIGATQSAAWLVAMHQAQSVGMLRD